MREFIDNNRLVIYLLWKLFPLDKAPQVCAGNDIHPLVVLPFASIVWHSKAPLSFFFPWAVLWLLCEDGIPGTPQFLYNHFKYISWSFWILVSTLLFPRSSIYFKILCQSFILEMLGKYFLCSCDEWDNYDPSPHGAWGPGEEAKLTKRPNPKTHWVNLEVNEQTTVIVKNGEGVGV